MIKWKEKFKCVYMLFVVQSPSHVWLCHAMDYSMPGLPVTHHLLEFVQVHVHCISDAIQPSHPLKPPSPPALSHQVVSYSSWPHGLQQARPPCPSPSPRVCLNSCSLCHRCCPAISSSDALFSFCLQSFLEPGTFPIRWPKSGSFNVSPSSDYSGLISLKIDWFDLLAVQRTFKNLLQHKYTSLCICMCQPSLGNPIFGGCGLAVKAS